MRTSTLATSAAAVATTAVAGSAGSDPDNAWYARLDKPSWQPPAVAFPIVWTALYASTTVALASAYDAARTRAGKRAIVAAAGTNLACNAAWPALFFRARRPWLAVGDAAAIGLSAAGIAAAVRHDSRLAAALLAPYAAWSFFATALSASIARRNA